MSGTAMKTIRGVLLAFLATFTLAVQARAVGYWGRMYDPNLQRWIQRDPIGEQGDINLYRSVGNDPVNFTDPLGLRDLGRPGNPLLGTGLNPVPFGTGVDYLLIGSIAAMATGGTAEALLVGGGLWAPGTLGTSVTIGTLSGVGGDLGVQGTRIALGKQSGLNPTELALSGAAGGVLGGAGNRLGALLKTKCPLKSGVGAARDAIGLADKIKASGMTTRQAGDFFGWGNGAEITKTASDFTRESLEAAGWTRERLAAVADAYRQIAQLTPQNPAAPVRAAQLEALLAIFK